MLSKISFTTLNFPTPKYSIEQMKEFAFKNIVNKDFKHHLYTYNSVSFNKIVESSEYRFDIDGKDVIVFIHIQKTAGTTFERFLVHNLNISFPCSCTRNRKRCNCLRTNRRENWLFSRFSTGWTCGLHADFTELAVSGCIDRILDEKEGTKHSRRYYFTTFLRNPVDRFISEYSHVKRGATWISSLHSCNGRLPTPDQLPLCFDPEIGWDGVELDEFLSCPYNLAFNRQTRMLADLTLVNCYNNSFMDENTRDRIILASAKTNLKNLAFFGIMEWMNESQKLFEYIFNIRFDGNLSNWNKSKSENVKLRPQQMDLITQRNKLDIELYRFALKLFNRRLKIISNASYIPPENSTRLIDDPNLGISEFNLYPLVF